VPSTDRFLPQPHAELDHSHRDRRAELLADAAHRQVRRGARGGVAFEDDDAALKPSGSGAGRARSDNPAADDRHRLAGHAVRRPAEK
jgi:hypothetical protein